MVGRKASGSELLAALGALAVLVATTASQNTTGNSTSGGGCINVHPDILEVQPGPGNVQIEWQLMDLTSVTGYLVMYKGSCDSQCRTKRVGNVNTTTIEGLHSHSNYTLRMTVVCNSTPSNTFTPHHSFTTPDQMVMVAPDNVSVAALNTSTMAVRWEALDPCDWNGDPVGYVVTVTDLTAGSQVRQNISWRHQAVHLLLGRGRSYNVSVSAVNNMGEGPPSAPITLTVQGEPCTSFFCTCYWYYVIGLGGALVIAIATTCVAFVCKMLCCRRKVSYARDNESKRIALSSSFPPHPPQQGGSEVDLDDIESMTDANSEMAASGQGDFPHYSRPTCDDARVYHVPYKQAPLRPPADWTGPPPYSANLNNSNYATLQSVNGSLNSQSQELHFDPSSAGKGFPQGMGLDHEVTPPTVMSQSGAFPYEVPSRSSSEAPQSLPVFRGSNHPSQEHIYQSVGDSPRPAPPHCGPRPAASSASSLTMPSWSSASNSREGSQDPQPNTLPRRGRGLVEEQWSPVSEEEQFLLPPPPEHPPPPLRRSTLDLMELMREETHHSSQGVLHSRALSSPSENHCRVSSSALRQPSSFPDLHSPVFSSDSSLANNGPTQTPPPELLSDLLWSKGSRSAQTPSHSRSAKHAQSQESQL